MVWGNDTGTWGLLWWLMLTLQGFLFREIKDIGLTFDSMVLNLKGWWECYQKQAVQNLFWEEKEFDFSCALKMSTVYWASIIYGKVSQLWHYWYVSQSTFCCWGLSQVPLDLALSSCSISGQYLWRLTDVCSVAICVWLFATPWTVAHQLQKYFQLSEHTGSFPPL